MNRANEVEMLARIAANIAASRDERGLSRNTLALRAEMHTTQIWRIEHRGRPPTVPAMIRLAGALERPIETLLTGISYQPPASGRSGHYLVEPLILPAEDETG